MTQAILAEILGNSHTAWLFWKQALLVTVITIATMTFSGVFERPARKMKIDVLTVRLAAVFVITLALFLTMSIVRPGLVGLKIPGTLIYCLTAVACLESLWVHRRGFWLDGPRVGRWQKQQEAKLVDPLKNAVRNLEKDNRKLEERDRQNSETIRQMREAMRRTDLVCTRERKRSDLLASTLAKLSRPPHAASLVVKRSRRTYRVAASNLLRLESEGADVRIHVRKGKTFLGRGALKDLCQVLDPREFISVSRSEIVRRDEIEYVERESPRRRVVVTRSGDRLPIPRSRWGQFDRDFADGLRL